MSAVVVQFQAEPQRQQRCVAGAAGLTFANLGQPAAGDPGHRLLRTLRSGQHLFRTGDPVNHLWSVEQGSLKVYGVTPEGREQITAFLFAGDGIGWEALACGRFPSNAVALEPCTLICVPVGAILEGALGSQPIQGWLLDGMRREFLRMQKILWMEHRNADGRLAALLLWLAEAQGRSEISSPEIRMPMSRRDIGSYLGMAFETVSRRLSLFDQHGWITSLGRRRIRINDRPHLQQMSET